MIYLRLLMPLIHSSVVKAGGVYSKFIYTIHELFKAPCRSK